MSETALSQVIAVVLVRSLLAPVWLTIAVLKRIERLLKRPRLLLLSSRLTRVCQTCVVVLLTLANVYRQILTCCLDAAIDTITPLTFKDQTTPLTEDLHSPFDEDTLRFCCAGGGIFFFWHAGVFRWLQRHADLQAAHFVGYSAGTLSAVLVCCGVDLTRAVHEAYHVAIEAKLFEKPLGLLGIWGGLVRQWLDRLLPADAAELCRGRLYIVATHVPSLQAHLFTNFATREDLIDCLMTSVHVPLFLDLRPHTSLTKRALSSRFHLQSGLQRLRHVVSAPAHLAGNVHVQSTRSGSTTPSPPATPLGVQTDTRANGPSLNRQSGSPYRPWGLPLGPKPEGSFQALGDEAAALARARSGNRSPLLAQLLEKEQQSHSASGAADSSIARSVSSPGQMSSMEMPASSPSRCGQLPSTTTTSYHAQTRDRGAQATRRHTHHSANALGGEPLGSGDSNFSTAGNTLAHHRSWCLHCTTTQHVATPAMVSFAAGGAEAGGAADPQEQLPAQLLSPAQRKPTRVAKVAQQLEAVCQTSCVALPPMPSLSGMTSVAGSVQSVGLKGRGSVSKSAVLLNVSNVGTTEQTACEAATPPGQSHSNAQSAQESQSLGKVRSGDPGASDSTATRSADNAQMPTQQSQYNSTALGACDRTALGGTCSSQTAPNRPHLLIGTTADVLPGRFTSADDEDSHVRCLHASRAAPSASKHTDAAAYVIEPHSGSCSSTMPLESASSNNKPRTSAGTANSPGSRQVSPSKRVHIADAVPATVAADCGHYTGSEELQRYIDGHVSVALHGRHAMAKLLGWEEGSYILVDHLQDKERGLSVWEFLRLLDLSMVEKMMAAGERYAERTWGQLLGQVSQEARGS